MPKKSIAYQSSNVHELAPKHDFHILDLPVLNKERRKAKKLELESQK